MRFHLWPVLLTLCLTLCSPAAAEGPAHLVADLNPGLANLTPESTHSFSSYTAVNGRVVFFGLLPEGVPGLSQSQCGLWVVDAASGGAERLADLCGGDLGDFRFDLHVLATTGAVAFFTDISGRLWRTDGTAAGTFPLRGVEVAGEAPGFGEPVLGPDGRTLFFSGCTAALGCEPWRSDGTRAGTQPVLDLVPGSGGSHPTLLTLAGNRVLFAAGGAVWSTDGTAAGTAQLARIPGSFLQTLLARGSAVYVLAVSQGSDTVWRLDTVSGNLRKLASFPSDGHRTGAILTAAGRRVLIVQYDSEDGLFSLWETDGSRAGTRRTGPPAVFSSLSYPLLDLGGRVVFSASRGAGTSATERLWVLDPGTAKPRLLQGSPLIGDGLQTSTVFAGRLYFAGRDAQGGCALWATDGTPRGTREIQDFCPTQLHVALGRLIAIDSQGDLWTSDGTPGGTVHVAPTAFVPASFGTFDFAESDGRIVFTGLDPQAGPQPFASDLIPGGTEALARIGGVLAGNSDPVNLTPLGGGRVLFNACDGHNGSGLWSSDGTEAGTRELPGIEDDCANPQLEILQRVGDLVYFDFQRRLWRTDGTPAGTFPLLDLPAQLRDPAALGGKLLFVIDPPSFPPSTHGWVWDFWTSDGTPAGTQPAFPFRFGGTPSLFAGAGGLIYFTAQSPDTPYPVQVWRTGGTEAGTRPILDLVDGGGNLPIEIAALGERVFFLAAARPGGPELWVTDGTAAGTAPVLPDLSGPRPANPVFLTAFRGALYFYAQSGDPAAWGLWRSDGTAAGTRLLKAVDRPHPVLIGGSDSSPELTPVGDQLFFRADDGVHGTELWKTDGTPEGTVLVKDIVPGRHGSRLHGLTAAGGKLYFGATDEIHGYELWQSDGTAAGTTLVQDILPGPAPSNPDQLTDAGSLLYFTANDGEHGRELWALPLPR